MHQQRQTKQRQVIESMLKQASHPLLPKELLDKAQESLPKLGIATVFRTLKKMVDEGKAKIVSLTPDTTTIIPIDLPINSEHELEPATEEVDGKVNDKEVASVIDELPEKNEHKVVIQKGDILSVLFDHYNLGQTTLRNILSADESLLALETLRPGQILYFRQKPNTQYLEEMELYKHPGHRIIYRRIADDAFNY
jgi:hypothetical protein